MSSVLVECCALFFSTRGNPVVVYRLPVWVVNVLVSDVGMKGESTQRVVELIRLKGRDSSVGKPSRCFATRCAVHPKPQQSL